ncbi:MAG: DUF447 family protein [Methanolinea sp.]|nr:DUF447 family protein [Methanolinea sp.]
MGLLKDGINEVIATTHWNAAPMGIISRDNTLKMVVFRGSHTAANISSHGWVVANIIFDPVIYVESAFGDLAKEHFVPEKIGDQWVHRLAGAEAWAAFSARVTRETDDTIMVELTPLYEQMLTCAVHPVNRGFYSIIEATVHATRYVRRRDPALMRLIDHHASLVRRCGGSREMEALALLQAHLSGERGSP